MSTNTTLEDQIAHRIGETQLGQLAAIDEIAAIAQNRNRRNRIMGGLGTIVAVGMLLIGVGSALREPEPSAVFAGEPSDLVAPWQVVPFDDGFVGLSPLGFGAYPELGYVELVVMNSPDGEVWFEVPDSPVFKATSSAIDVGPDQMLHIVTTSEHDGPTLEHTTSVDLNDWQTRRQPLPEGVQVESDAQNVGVRSIVAADAGVLALLSTSPSQALANDLVAAEVGDAALCHQEFSPGRYRIRACGSPDVISIPIAIPDSEWFTWHALFAPSAGDFAPTDTPDSYGRFNGPPATIYRAGDGFGFTDWDAAESLDGVIWTPVDLVNTGNWMVAGRGQERVFRSRNTFSGATGPDGPPKEWGYSPDGGEIVTWIQPEAVWGDQIEPFFIDLRAGEAGWVLVTGRRADPIVDEAAGQSYEHGYSDFSMTNNGMTLAGGRVPGPATLTDERGVVVRSWEHFEFTNLAWSGFERTATGVAIPDADTGEQLAEFPIDFWAALARPGTNSQRTQYEVLFSANGLNWSIVHTSSSFPMVGGVGPQEIFLAFVDGDMSGQAYAPRTQMISVADLLPE